MDEHRQRELRDRHPTILGRIHLDCGNGWFDVIDVLCDELERQAEWAKQAPPRAIQVKEKFGGLRFYTDRSNDVYFALTKLAESMSFRVCENCGNPGKLRPGIVVSTLCSTCFERHKGKERKWNVIDDWDL